MMKFLAAVFCYLFVQSTFICSQSIGISHNASIPDSSSILDISAANKGVLLPRMTKVQRDSIQFPAEGLTIYQTNDWSGYYVFKNGSWSHLGPIYYDDALNPVPLNSSNVYNMQVAGAQFISDSSGILYDTGGPTGNYGNNENRTTVIQVPQAVGIIVVLEESQMEPFYDSLTIADKSYSGTETDSIFIPQSSVIIRFNSNNIQTQAGFKITWRAVRASEIEPERINLLSGWQYDPSSTAVFGGIGSNANFNPDSIGRYSVNFGVNNKSLGYASTTFGRYNNNRSIGSIMAGSFNLTNGDNSIVVGDYNSINEEGNIVGGTNGNVDGKFNIINGENAEVYGNQNVHNGFNNDIYGDDNLVQGLGHQVTGSQNIVSGENNVVVNAYTQNMINGNQHYIDGRGNLLVGTSNSVFNDNSIIGGENNGSDFKNCLIIGEGNGSLIKNSIVGGQYSDLIFNHISPFQTGLLNIGMGIDQNNKKSGLVFTDQGKLLLGASDGDEINILNSPIYIHTSGSQTMGSSVHAGVIASLEGESETGGLMFNGDAVTLWSPGDGHPNDGITGGVSLYILDEDAWSDGNSNPYDNGAVEAYLNSSGLWQQSDQNKKENMEKIQNCGEKLSSLSPYTYSFKHRDGEIEKKEVKMKTIGLIAQDVIKVFPEAVTLSDHGDYFVNYSQIIPILIGSNNELKVQNELLETQLELQNRRLDELENLVRQLVEEK